MNSYTYFLHNHPLTITEDKGEIVRISFDDHASAVVYESDLIKMCYTQIVAFEAGKRRGFSVPFRLIGTPFQIEVWEAIMAIPYGETISYGAIAQRIGRPRAARAVGTACNKCPLDYIVPCHRVLASYGLGGYGKHIDWKLRLLNLEAKHG